MKNKPTQEQIKEFWEWCGFHLETDNRKGYHWEFGHRYHDWLTPDGQTSGGNHGINKGKLPALDLNNLFKYAVPKLQHKQSGYTPEIVLYKAPDESWGAYIGDFRTYEIATTSALALFWAIWKVIHKGE